MIWTAVAAILLVTLISLLRRMGIIPSLPDARGGIPRLVRIGTWFAAMALTIGVLRPDTPAGIAIWIVVYVLLAAVCELVLSWNSVVGFVATLPTGSILDKGLTLVPMWTAEVELPPILRTNQTYVLKFGFRRRLVPLQDERLLAENTSVRGERDEECPLGTGSLRTDKHVRLRITAPGFAMPAEYDSELTRLEQAPLNVPCMPKEVGSHFVVIDYLAPDGAHLGGITIPVSVRERDPLTSVRALRILQIAGAALGLIAGVKVIADALIRLMR